MGGGAQIDAGVTVPAPRQVFNEQWPVALRDGALSPHFDRVAEVIQPAPLKEALPRTRALEHAGAILGATVRRLPVAMNGSVDSADLHVQPEFTSARAEVAMWLRGGRATRRRGLDRTYLADAEMYGADIRPLDEVELISPEGDGYRVSFSAPRPSCRRTGHAFPPTGRHRCRHIALHGAPRS